MFGCQLYIYRPPTKLWEGNVFTPVCHSVQWEVVSPLGGDSLDGEPLLDIVYPWTEIVPGQRPPWTETPPGLTSSGGHRCGLYASYWNAYLFAKFSENPMKLTKLWWIGNGRPITSPMWVVQTRKGKRVDLTKRRSFILTIIMLMASCWCQWILFCLRTRKKT